MTQAQITPIRQRQRPSQRDLQIEGAEGTIEVTRSAYGREGASQERIRVPIYHGPLARVRVEGSVTRNLGDYNSARVAVAVELPCYPVEADIQSAYEYASTLIDNLLPLELEKAVTPSN